MSTETKIRKLVKGVLPKGRRFKIAWHPVGLGRYRVLRVITPAWRSLPRFDRILKVQEAISRGLTPHEQKDIFRVSVLTSEEYKHLFPFPSPSSPARPKRRSANGAATAARRN